MSKKFLGIICLIYSIIIIYVWKFDILKNFLAPNMQIYLKLSLIPLIIMGLVLCFNEKLEYKFKISDLVLILPIVLLIIAGDGRLSASFASNRMTNFNSKKTKVLKEIKKEKTEENKEEIIEPEIKEEVTYDFDNPDFDIIDDVYFDLANHITFISKSDEYVGKTIKVRGFVTSNEAYLPKGYFAIGKYAVSCCAADASFVGFIVKKENYKVKANNWYEIEGILEKSKDQSGYDILTIKIVNIRDIDKKTEEQYVYPCYYYDDGYCNALEKYNLKYE